MRGRAHPVRALSVQRQRRALRRLRGRQAARSSAIGACEWHPSTPGSGRSPPRTLSCSSAWWSGRDGRRTSSPPLSMAWPSPTDPPTPSDTFDKSGKNLCHSPDTPNPPRGIIATGWLFSRSFDLGGRFLPETPKNGSSLWARFALAVSRNVKFMTVSTHQNPFSQRVRQIFDAEGVVWTRKSKLPPVTTPIFDIYVKTYFPNDPFRLSAKRSSTADRDSNT